MRTPINRVRDDAIAVTNKEFRGYKICVVGCMGDIKEIIVLDMGTKPSGPS